MAPRQVTEADIIEVLLGNADPALEERVRQAVRTDLKTAACYTEWSRLLPMIHEGARPAAEMSERVVDGVMGRIRSTENSIEAKSGTRTGASGRPWEITAAFLGTETPNSTHGCENTFLGKIIDWFPRSRPEARVKQRALVWMAAAAAVLIGLSWVGVDYVRWFMNTARFDAVSGGVYAAESDGETAAQSPEPVEAGSRRRLPFNLQVDLGGKAVVSLPGGNRMFINEATTVMVNAPQSVSQTLGTVRYRIDRWKKNNPFTVGIPQGSIVDLGTEFEVDVDTSKGSVVRVQTGRVRVMPRAASGSVQAAAGDRVLLNERQAVVESALSPPPSSEQPRPAPRSRIEEKKSPTTGQLQIPWRPSKKTLAPDNNLCSFISGKQIVLSSGAIPPQLRKSPPFTMASPYLGILKTLVEDRDVEAVAACDRKLNGKWRIYFDANLNGDLTDDPSFSEGEDFVAGRPFRAGTFGKDHVVYLRLPIRINRSGESPTAEAAYDRLDYLNYNYLTQLVEIPSNSGSKTASVPEQFLLLDSNSDGAYFENDGAIEVWTNPTPIEGSWGVRSLGAFGSPTVNLGYRWNLTRDLSGAFSLTGEKLDALQKRKPLSVGEAFPPLTVKTLTGDNLKLEAPPKGYLLVYVWSTWIGSGQRDAPFEFNDLAPKFANRGLKMVGISVDYRKQDLANYLLSKKVSYPQVYNGPNLWEGAASELGITEVPIAILVDGSGAVVSVGQSADWLWTFLDANLPSKGAESK